jgi:hypothetical protein
MMILSLLLLLVCFPHSVSGYASWLRCFIELDEEEVIMHHKIISAENSRETVTIQVQPYDGSTDWISDYALPNHPTTVKVQLHIPSELGWQDVQFVIEAVNAEFIDRGVMCDGSRAFSRRHDEHVVLKIMDTSQPVELTAAWAPGFEAVTLTPKLILTTTTPTLDGGEL